MESAAAISERTGRPGGQLRAIFGVEPFLSRSIRNGGREGRNVWAWSLAGRRSLRFLQNELGGFRVGANVRRQDRFKLLDPLL